MKTLILFLFILTSLSCISESTRVTNPDYPANASSESSNSKETLKKEIAMKKVEDEKTYQTGMLIDAVMAGEIEEVKSILKMSDLDINEKDSNGDTALHLATGYQVGPDAKHLKLISEIKIVRLLLTNKADVNMKNNSEDTPLTIASHYCETDMIQLLLDYKANGNLENNEGNNALHYAVYCPLPFVKLLIENRTPMNKKNLEGKTPLAIAKEAKNTKVISYLISQGAR